VQHLLSVHAEKHTKHNVISKGGIWLAPNGGVATGKKTDCGMVFMAANFNRTVIIGNYTLTPEVGATNVFLVKLSPFKEVEWVITGGGEGETLFTSVIYAPESGDEEAAVYVTGVTTNFNSSFGVPERRDFVFHNAQQVQNAFVLKVSGKGVILWVVKAVGAEAQIFNSAALDQGGNLFLVGTSGGQAKFHHADSSQTGSIGDQTAISHPVTLGNTGVTQVFTSGFMAKVSRLGQVLWALKMGPQSNQAAGDDSLSHVLIHQSSGSLYVTGSMSGPAVWSQAQGTLFGEGGNAVLFKTDLDGKVSWMVGFGKEGSVVTSGVAIDPASADVFLAASFPSAMSPLRITGDDHRPFFVTSGNNATGSRDVFLLKLSNLGTPDWVLSGGGPGVDSIGSISGTASGHILLGGSFGGHATTGAQWGGQQFTLPPESTAKPVAGQLAIPQVSPFVSKITSTGTVEWATSNGMVGPIDIQSVASDGCGNAVVGGLYSSASTFGTTSPLLTQEESIFAAKVGNIFTQCLCDLHGPQYLNAEVEQSIVVMRLVIAAGVAAIALIGFMWWKFMKPKTDLANQYIKNNYWNLHQDNRSRAMLRPKLDNIFSASSAAPTSAYARVATSVNNVLPQRNYFQSMAPQPPAYTGHQPGSLTNIPQPFLPSRSSGPSVAEARQQIAAMRSNNSSAQDYTNVNHTRNHM